jgi:hypothetical protein
MKDIHLLCIPVNSDPIYKYWDKWTLKNLLNLNIDFGIVNFYKSITWNIFLFYMGLLYEVFILLDIENLLNVDHKIQQDIDNDFPLFVECESSLPKYPFPHLISSSGLSIQERADIKAEATSVIVLNSRLGISNIHKYINLAIFSFFMKLLQEINIRYTGETIQKEIDDDFPLYVKDESSLV